MTEFDVADLTAQIVRAERTTSMAAIQTKLIMNRTMTAAGQEPSNWVGAKLSRRGSDPQFSSEDGFTRLNP